MYKEIKKTVEDLHRYGKTKVDVAEILYATISLSYILGRIRNKLTDEQEEEVFSECLKYVESLDNQYTNEILLDKVMELIKKYEQ